MIDSKYERLLPGCRLILLVNLGSPEALSVSAIKRFLREFLSDKRVVALPRFIWYPILYGIILPLRSKRLLKQYAAIWLSGGSPLVHYTKAQASKLDVLFKSNSKVEGADITLVRHAFCYSAESIASILAEVHSKYSINDLHIIPLYPQFSSTTTLPVFDQVARFYQDKMYLPSIKFIRGFSENKLYIAALCAKIKKSWELNGKAEHMVFSYHSLPKSIIEAGDTYYAECKATTALLVKELGLSEGEYSLSFQSKFGYQKWLTPSTSQTLEDLAKSGIKSLDIACPGFVGDCLETLEEIAQLNRDVFLSNGGVKYNYIPCLNDDDNFIQVLHQFVAHV